MLRKLLFYLKVSRPGLWFATGWLYILPTSQSPELLYTWIFWYGLFYVSFPLNFLVYGWNDRVDFETDALNPRKDSFWFGARGTKEQLQQLWKPMLVVQLLTIPIILYVGGLLALVVFILFFLINYLYNLPTNGLRSKPPWELVCQVGYLLIVPLSISINTTDHLPPETYLYLLLFAAQSHLMGEVMDYQPDLHAGRSTTATKLGVMKTKLLIIGLMISEILLLIFRFQEYIFSAVLGLGLLWLIIDLTIIFKAQTYNQFQMKLFAASSNLIAIVTIVYVWYSGCLMS